jgi:Ca2+-binding EF-hand superfamily protein
MQDSEYNSVSGVLYDKPRKIEHYEKRFSLIAIKKGFICADDLVKVLTIQVGEDVNNAPHRFMGEILFDLGVMTDKQVEDVLSTLFQRTRAPACVGSGAD